MSFLDGQGSGSEILADTIVGGNVAFVNGAARFYANLGSFTTSSETVVRGNLTITGTAASTINLGNSLPNGGLVVGKNLSITAGVGPCFLNLRKVQVSGSTILRLGDGYNGVNIDDSMFGESFRLTTGNGKNAVLLDTIAGSSGATRFCGPVMVNLGTGDDTLTLAGSVDMNQAVQILSAFVVHHGTGSDTLNANQSHEFFPFGTSIEWVA